MSDAVDEPFIRISDLRKIISQGRSSISCDFRRDVRGGGGRAGFAGWSFGLW